MKNLLFTCLLFTALGFCVSCGDDAEEIAPIEFKEQDLQGFINGKDWIYKIGRVVFDQNRLFMNIYEESSIDICSAFPSGNLVLFSVPNSRGYIELKVGDFNSSQTVALYDELANENIIATEGAIEILTIDLDNKIVTGRMDVRTLTGDFMNGNFTLDYCF